MRHPHDPPESGDLTKTEVRLVDAETWALKDKAEVAAGAYALAFSPDGTRLAVGDARRVGKGRDSFYMKIWDVREGKLASAAKGGKATTAAEEKKIAALIVDLDNDGADVREKAAKELADLGRPAEEVVRQALARGPSPASRARLEKVLTMLGRGGLPVSRLAFSPDGKLLASGGFGDDDGKVCLFDGLSGEAIRALDGHSKMVTGVSFSPDGKTLVTGSLDKTVKLWDVGSGKLQRTLAGIAGPVTALAFSWHGRLLATAAGPDQPGEGNVKVHIWDTKTWEPTRVFPDQAAEVDSLAFSPDGSVLALGGGNRAGVGGPGTPAEGRCDTPGELKLWRVR